MNNTKVVGFCPAMPSFVYLFFTQKEGGGRGDFKPKVLREAKASGRLVEDVANNVRSVLCAKGSVLMLISRNIMLLQTRSVR